jgi:predicted O-methyltransferase YrrM
MADIQQSELALHATHPLLRGGFVAIVFSGRSDALGTLAGEPTAHTSRKFVLEDLSLEAREDFARSGGSTLPHWPHLPLRPVPGVCFVFTNASHPALNALVRAGAKVGEDMVIVEEVVEADADRALVGNLSAVLRHARSNGSIVILGYGHQGQRIARCLHEELAVPASQIVVHDDHAPSRAAGERDGLTAMCDEHAIADAAAVIASPLQVYARVMALLNRATSLGIPTFNNARRASGLRHWREHGSFLLDETAERSAQVRGSLLTCEDEITRSLLAVHVIREDQRTLAGVDMPHLHSGQTLTFADDAPVDLALPWQGDGLARSTFSGLRRAFVGTSNRASHGFFAARQLCLDLWPDTTRHAFPSEHAIDLGATAFERLLKSNLDSREIVSTMQTPPQRVVLGIMAAHAVRAAGGGPIIEIGSAFGGSALLMTSATDSSSAQVISIDPDAPTRDIMRFAFERHGYGQRLQQVVATSDDAIARLRHLAGACSLVFIDGLHTAQAVARDFHNYAPLLAAGGVLAFHDVCPAIHSVLQAVVQHVLPDRRFQVRCLVDGLLVLERVA